MGRAGGLLVDGTAEEVLHEGAATAATTEESGRMYGFSGSRRMSSPSASDLRVTVVYVRLTPDHFHNI